MTNKICCSDNAGPFPVDSCLPGKESPIAVQRKRTKGWRLPANTVCVTRPGKWGNMFPVAVFGRERAIQLYEQFFNVSNISDLPEDAQIYAAEWRYKHFRTAKFLSVREMAVHDLKGKNLACWCETGSNCHTEVLLRVANAILVQHTPIVANKISKNNWVASSVYWIVNERKPEFKISVDRFGKTEKEAISKLKMFFNS